MTCVFLIEKNEAGRIWFTLRSHRLFSCFGLLSKRHVLLRQSVVALFADLTFTNDST
jgi:hypothetical protein